MNIFNIIKEEADKVFNQKEYLKWKLENVTLRGMKELGKENEVYGSFGKGLYTAYLSNYAMAKQYGTVYFAVGARPKKPKIVNSLNEAEIFRQNLIFDFCKKYGKKYLPSFFEENTSMEDEMLNLGYDGFVIKGREMVNYKPGKVDYIKYSKDEYYLKNYYIENVIQ
jgi:hypothetical protein